jgi:polyisoprenoid-binding protein YceI
MDRPLLRRACRMLECALALGLLLGGPAAARAQGLTLELDPSLTQVRWTLPGFPETVHGTFTLRKGIVRFDPTSRAADGLIELDASSGASGNGARDRRMHEEILEVDRYPLITFRPFRLDGTYRPAGAQEIQLSGALSLHGSEHPFVLSIHVTTEGGRVTADTRFTVPYVAWGLKDPSVLILRSSKTVDIEVHAVGRLQPTVQGGQTGDH